MRQCNRQELYVFLLIAACVFTIRAEVQNPDELRTQLVPMIEDNDFQKAVAEVIRFKNFVVNEQKALEQQVERRATQNLPAGKGNLDREEELKTWLADVETLLNSFAYAKESGTAIAGTQFSPRDNEQRIFKKNVLNITPEFTLWTADGSTRVDRDKFMLPEKVWANEKLRYVLRSETEEIGKITEPGCSGIVLSQAANEYESFNLVITPKSGDLKVSDVRISDFLNKNGAKISASNTVIKYVGEVSGNKLGDDKLIGPYPDVRFPLSYDTLAEKAKNYAMYCTVFVPPGTAAGEYSGTVTLQIGSRPVAVPLAIKVYPFELPKQTTVNMMLMGMWLADMDYHYGLNPWSDESQTMKKAWAEQMAALRFSPCTIPLLPRIRWEEFPVQSEGFAGEGLLFKENRQVTVAGPWFKDLTDSFTVSFHLKTGQKDMSEFMAHRWTSRPSGYGFSMAGGKLSANIGIASKAETPDEVDVSTVSVLADYPSDGKWHHVALNVTPHSATLYLDGNLAAEKELAHPLSLAYGQTQLKGSGFSIDELRWSKGRLSAEQIKEESLADKPVYCKLSAYSFNGPEYDFAAKVGKESPEDMDVATTIAWAEWTQRHGLYPNNILFPKGWSHEQIDTAVITPLRKLGLVNQISVKMPCDEAVMPPQSDQNIAFAKEFRKKFPDIKIYHTVGAMGGVRNPWAQRQAQLERYDEYVDIWGMRPVIADTYWDSFFKKRVADGDDLAPYIHFCDQVENPRILILSRSFFYRLMQLNIKSTTYWAVNMWYQPIKALGHGSRAERNIKEVPNGYWLMLRNWTGITAGMIFYPLPEGPEASLIAMSWRDGIEDYEYLTLLKNRLAQAEARQLKGSAIEDARRLIKQIDTTEFVQNRWQDVPSADSGQLNQLRERVAFTISALDQVLKRDE